MERISAEQACEALRQGRRVSNRGWTDHRTLAAADLDRLSPETLRSLAGPPHAGNWYVVPDEPLRVAGDGTAGRPFGLDDSGA